MIKSHVGYVNSRSSMMIGNIAHTMQFFSRQETNETQKFSSQASVSERRQANIQDIIKSYSKRFEYSMEVRYIINRFSEKGAEGKISSLP